MKCLYNDYSGNGIFEIDGKKIYIPGVLKDEEVILKKGKHYELVKILKESKDRTKVLCPSFYLCGGCQYQHLSYELEKIYKEKYLKQLFNQDIKLTTMTNPLNYRNKIQYVIEDKDKLSLGLYKEKTRDFIKINKCYLHNNLLDEIANYLKELFLKYKLSAYSQKTKKGLIKNILLKTNYNNSEVLVCIVISDKLFPKRKDIIKDLTTKYKEIKTIIVNYNFRDTPIILGELSDIVYGNGYIKDKILDYEFLVGHNTFYQINHEGVEILYSEAIKSLKLTKNDSLIDAYCGVGTIGIIASKSVKNVIGIELNKDSINIARSNLKLNKINNVNFICGDSTKVLKDLANKKIAVNSLILDPPRSGSTVEFIKAIKQLNIKKVAYVSCEPETLKRDLETFKSLGYQVEELKAVDMFPRTFNIEMICILKLK